jgi:hypothetical protein
MMKWNVGGAQQNFFELQPSSLFLVDDTFLQAILIQSFNTRKVLNIQAQTNWYENFSHSTLSHHCRHPVMTVNTQLFNSLSKMIRNISVHDRQVLWSHSRQVP